MIINKVINEQYVEKKSNDSDMVTLLHNSLANMRFYGRIEIVYQAGKIVNVKTEQSLKPEDIVSFLKNNVCI